jgi:epoxyqueuosine reductase
VPIQKAGTKQKRDRLGVNYAPEHDPLAVLAQKDRGAISVYAQGDDYHDVIRRS